MSQLDENIRGEFVSVRELIKDTLDVAKKLMGSNRGKTDQYFTQFLNASIKRETDLEMQVI